MSLFDKITQGFLQVSNLFSTQNVSSNQTPELSKTAQTNFWTNPFGGRNTSAPNLNANNLALNLTAQKVAVTDVQKAAYYKKLNEI